MEVKEISHHLGYWVAEDGKIFSQKYGRRVELKQSEHKGYRRVALSQNNKRTIYPVHRLVAEAFIPNPDSKPLVNHKDGNKRGNHWNNLEWCTAKENQAHSREILGNTGLGERNPNHGYRKSRFYPSQELRNRLIELEVPRNRHDIVSLGEMLPDNVIAQKLLNKKSGKSVWYAQQVLEGDCISDHLESFYYTTIKEHSEANARAKMLIYLLENHLITLIK